MDKIDNEKFNTKLSKMEVKTKNLSFPFYYKTVSKETGGYFFRIIKGDVYKKIDYKNKVNLIIDLGANFGSASICFALRYPDATIMAFEPATETYKILELNTKIFNQIFCYNLAASNKSKEQKIYIDTDKMGRSSLVSDHLNYNFNHQEKVQSVDFNNFIIENNIDKIDILKIDIEGSEYKVLTSMKNFLINVGIIYIEMHGKNNINKLRKLLSLTHFEKNYVSYSNELSESIYINKQIKNL